MDTEETTLMDTIGSPNRKTPSSVAFGYDRNAEAWAERHVSEELLTERAATPVMGNRVSRRLSTSDIPMHRTPSTLRSGHSVADDPLVYGRHFDALRSFLHGKRHISERLGLAEQEMELNESSSTFVTAKSSDDIHLLEANIELQFLQSLEQAAKDEEANFWMLLVHLRSLDLTALLWPDDENSRRQYAMALEGCLSRLANSRKTPQEVIDELNATDSANTPLSWKRIRCLQKWLEACFAKEISPYCPPSSQKLVIDGTEGLPIECDSGTMKRCLSLILAGRLDEACQVMHKAKLDWRVAQWQGGQPLGVSSEGNIVGNANRALWRRVMWQLTESLAKEKGSNPDEVAISALLSNHWMVGLDNSSLRTWYKGLYTMIRSLAGRTEDQALSLQIEEYRHQRPPYPGSQVRQDVLRQTAELANLSEASMVDHLNNSPFEKMKAATNFFTQSTAHFVQGREAVSLFLKAFSEHDSWQLSEHEHRFLTHLILYIHSLQDTGSAATAIFGDLTSLKDLCLVRYLDILASRELWQYVSLYASLLRSPVDHLPLLLQNVQDAPTRSLVVKQLREFIPGEDLKIVVATVQLSFPSAISSKPFVPGSINSDAAGPTDKDLKQMKALQWLDVLPDHGRTGLLWANRMLRQFLLNDKVQAAQFYVRESRAEAIEALLTDDAGDDDAVMEQMAMECLLFALASVEEWEQVQEKVATQLEQNFASMKIDFGGQRLTAAQQVSLDMQRREYIDGMKSLLATLVEATTRTQQALQAVLEYAGGWLQLDGPNNDGVQDYFREQQLEDLRGKMLPDVVKKTVNVYRVTAERLNAACNVTAERLGICRGHVVARLDPADKDDSPMSPVYWTEIALDLAIVVNSDEFNVSRNMDIAEIKEFMRIMGEVQIAHLMYTEYPKDAKTTA